MICCNSTSATHHCQDHLECGAGSGGHCERHQLLLQAAAARE